MNDILSKPTGMAPVGRKANLKINFLPIREMEPAFARKQEQAMALQTTLAFASE
jgi:hypothetical protein